MPSSAGSSGYGSRGFVHFVAAYLRYRVQLSVVCSLSHPSWTRRRVG